MFGDFLVLRDFYDGFDFVMWKVNIVDKNSKKKKKRLIDSYKWFDMKLYVKIYDIGVSLICVMINFRYDMILILKEVLK